MASNGDCSLWRGNRMQMLDMRERAAMLCEWPTKGKALWAVFCCHVGVFFKGTADASFHSNAPVPSRRPFRSLRNWWKPCFTATLSSHFQLYCIWYLGIQEDPVNSAQVETYFIIGYTLCRQTLGSALVIKVKLRLNTNDLSMSLSRLDIALTADWDCKCRPEYFRPELVKPAVGLGHVWCLFFWEEIYPFKGTNDMSMAWFVDHEIWEQNKQGGQYSTVQYS